MNKPVDRLIIDEKTIGENYPTYFIADISANHDGDLERAKDLIWKAKSRSSADRKARYTGHPRGKTAQAAPSSVFPWPS